ncbi:MAG: hypothetical protein H8E66_11975 [Planctomycetes bacterium]|nr:hypothetical protein [Planctomycetota bacterium]MBL7043251.1 hypothetical protein [Pirellulaceae bacterium]
MGRYAIVCRNNGPRDKTIIQVPEFFDHVDSLAQAIQRVESFCATKGLQLTEIPSAVSKGDEIYNDSSGGLKAIVKAWDCHPSERIHICDVNQQLTDESWWFLG